MCVRWSNDYEMLLNMKGKDQANRRLEAVILCGLKK